MTLQEKYVENATHIMKPMLQQYGDNVPQYVFDSHVRKVTKKTTGRATRVYDRLASL